MSTQTKFYGLSMALVATGLGIATQSCGSARSRLSPAQYVAGDLVATLNSTSIGLVTFNFALSGATPGQSLICAVLLNNLIYGTLYASGNETLVDGFGNATTAVPIDCVPTMVYDSAFECFTFITSSNDNYLDPIIVSMPASQFTCPS